MEMEKQGGFGQGETTERQHFQHKLQVIRSMMFVLRLSPESNWRYVGEDVKFGDAGTTIFWYRPEVSQTYRVIYGDLSVQVVAQEDLPK